MIACTMPVTPPCTPSITWGHHDKTQCTVSQQAQGRAPMTLGHIPPAKITRQVVLWCHLDVAADFDVVGEVRGLHVHTGRHACLAEPHERHGARVDVGLAHDPLQPLELAFDHHHLTFQTHTRVRGRTDERSTSVLSSSMHCGRTLSLRLNRRAVFLSSSFLICTARVASSNCNHTGREPYT